MPSFADITAVDWTEKVAEYPHLKEVTLVRPFVQGKCGLLLGNNCARLIAPEKVAFVNQNDLPVAHKTQLGWSIAGPTNWVQGSSPWTGEALERMGDHAWTRVRSQSKGDL